MLAGFYIDPTQAPSTYHSLTNITVDSRDPDVVDDKSKIDHPFHATVYLLCVAGGSSLTGRPPGAPPGASSAPGRIEDAYGGRHSLDLTKKQRRGNATGSHARTLRGATWAAISTRTSMELFASEGFGASKPDEPERRYTSATNEPFRTPLPGNLQRPLTKKVEFKDGVQLPGNLQHPKGAKPKFGDGIRLPGNLQAPKDFKLYKIQKLSGANHAI